MKKSLQFIGIVVLAILLNSCGGGIKEIKLFPVKSGKDFGFVDRTGKTVINPQFGRAGIFRDGIAVVRTSGDNAKYGYINEDGKYTINATYKKATIFNDGLAWVVSENGAPTAINEKGEVKFAVQDAQMVRTFKEGVAAYSIADDKGEKWGFLDKTGKPKINPQFSYAQSFSDGKAAVANSDNKWGYIDNEGKIAISYQFEGASEFKNGKAVVRSGGKYGLIDKDGKYLINPQYSALMQDGDMFLFEQDGKWGWCDKDGKIVINPQFSSAFPFLGGKLAAVRSGENFGYVDKQGKIVISSQFEEALPFNGSLAIVMSGKKVGLIDKDGKYVVNPQFDDVSGDVYDYILTGGSEFDYAETDFFNMNAITDRVKKDITDKSVAGNDFQTTIASILTKYNKTQSDFGKYSSDVQVLSDDKINKDASIDLYVIGSPWSPSGYYDYTFNTEAKPTGFRYEISLHGKAYSKSDDILKAVNDVFASYTKDTEYSNSARTVYKGNGELIAVYKKYGNVVIETIPAPAAS